MTLEQPTLNEFVRHAERYGSECVYETATDYLEPEELGLLALALQRIDRRWRLTPSQRVTLATALDAARIPADRICEMAQISIRTLYRLREETAPARQPRKTAPETAQPCGEIVPNRADATTDTSRAKMAHRAPSGAPVPPPRAAARTRPRSRQGR